MSFIYCTNGVTKVIVDVEFSAFTAISLTSGLLIKMAVDVRCDIHDTGMKHSCANVQWHEIELHSWQEPMKIQPST